MACTTIVKAGRIVLSRHCQGGQDRAEPPLSGCHTTGGGGGGLHVDSRDFVVVGFGGGLRPSSRSRERTRGVPLRLSRSVVVVWLARRIGRHRPASRQRSRGGGRAGGGGRLGCGVRVCQRLLPGDGVGPDALAGGRRHLYPFLLRGYQQGVPVPDGDGRWGNGGMGGISGLGTFVPPSRRSGLAPPMRNAVLAAHTGSGMPASALPGGRVAVG